MFSMTCYPANSTPYTVTYNSVARQAAITGGRTGFVRMYHALDVTDKPSRHILYVATKAPGQTRTLYLAFDYSGINTDVSSIRVTDRASDKTDKCASDNFQAAALPMRESINLMQDCQPPNRKNFLRYTAGPYIRVNLVDLHMSERRPQLGSAK
jgi:hypothetical protein